MSALVLACTREAVCDDLVTTYEGLFNDHVAISIPGYSGGSNKLNNFPLLVRVSEGNPEGFSYARVDSAGADIRFLYSDGGATPEAVPYEVDTWNTNGVSALWVRLPAVNNNPSTRLTMYWAPDEPSALPANAPSSVWSGYTAVWHMNDAADSTANRLAAMVGERASTQSGMIGSALGTRASGANGQVLTASPCAAISGLTSGAYTISAWLRVNAFSGTPWFYSARTALGENAFGAEILSSSGLALKLHADATTFDGPGTKRFSLGSWAHVAVVHDGATDKHHIWLNGTEFYNPDAVRTDVSGLNGLAFGGLVGEDAPGTLNGDLDDIRIYPGVLSRSFCTNEYLQAASSGYIAFSDFYSTGKEVYKKTPGKKPGDDPSPGPVQDVSPADYAGTAVFVPERVDTGVVLTNFVTMIKVWEGAPAGFVPRDLPFGTEDLRFFDEQGNVLAYDIDLWDVDGDSFFWVKIPQLTASSRITMCWGLREGRTLPPNESTSVWSDYAGVWHMTDETDSTANRAVGAFGDSATLMLGQVGKAAGTMVSGAHGAILDVEATPAVDALTNGPFTVSGWVQINKPAVSYGALFSRATSSDPAWGALFNGPSGDSSEIAMTAGGPNFSAASDISAQTWVKFDFTYAADRLTFFIDGEQKGESVLARTILNGSSGRLAIGGLVSAAEGVLGPNTLNGYIDEFRLKPGRPSAVEMEADITQCTYEDFYDRKPASWDSTAVLQNRWRVYPTATKTEWNEGEEPAEFTLGEPWYGTSELSFVDRSTGEVYTDVPTTGGDYRAVFTCAQTGRYSSLTYTIDFRIRLHRPSHDLGVENDRILLLNSDESVADGKVYVQAYSDSVNFPGRPYWWHDVDSDLDYTSTSTYYNFCGGLHHTYWGRGAGDDRTRLWDLIDVRYGNTYNNADTVFDETGDWEEWDDGLSTNQNYLAWNPRGGCLVDLYGLEAEGWHEYAAQAVMCNTLKASINSTLYTNGIGTIYFDAVNSHVDDAGVGYYKLVVEMATNALDRATGLPAGLPTDEAIAATHIEWNPERGEYVQVVHDPYKFADWKPLTMRVKLVNGSTMTDLAPTNELDLSIASGGSYTNFFRVYVPVDFLGVARFRIRRTAINPNYTIATDVHSMILVDNVICSAPTDRVRIEPRGIYDETKVKRETVGYEGAFKPSYPGITDSELYARVRAKTLSGEDPAPGTLSSVLMHYRWRYLNQQCTDWMTSDIDPLSLTSIGALSWPRISGDLEYWYETNQSGEFYQYADYSGLNLGLEGYTEEVLSVTNRAETYFTQGKDWFTRIRDGKSTYGTIKLFVRRGPAAPVESVEMFVARDQIWRGCLQTTNAVAAGIYFRFEGRNCQDDTLPDFQFNTNFWYLTEPAEKLPVSGSVIGGTTNDWGWVPCDGATGHILFQLDEKTRALTVAHADWQDFNGWNDAHRDYFTGTSTDDASKSGVSPEQRDYLCYCNRWADDVATNQFWIERFSPTSLSGREFYSPFVSALTPNGFTANYGMWVPSAYSLVRQQDGHYEQALQMAGQGQGAVQMTNPTVSPRGLEAIKFNARIAQKISPDDFARYDGGYTLKDYSFLTRAAFDFNANSNFTGNASLSLAAFYTGDGCYEARWEQLDGDIEDGSGTILGPKPRGQRLALYRWKFAGQWQATELYAATNSGSVYSWKQTYSPKAIPATYSITNGLMPFMIGAYDNAAAGKNYTVIVAAVHIKGVADAAQNVQGNSVHATLTSSGLGGEQGWLYLVYRDSSADRLVRGTYGVLSANCEGVFARPQLHTGIVSWLTRDNTRTLDTQIWPGASATRGETASFYSYASVRECVTDIADGFWTVRGGRMEAFYETKSDDYNGLRASVVTQSVDIYTAPIGTSSWSSAPITNCQVTGFGKPGPQAKNVLNLWSTDDSSVQLRAGGKYDTGIRTDVVVDNIEISQWRGTDWLGNNATERGQCGPTNFVYTSGWISNGALQLSPRRTPDHYPSSLRVPLCDGQGPSRAKRGLGLGSLSIWYRNAQPNARLLFQIATNGVSQTTLESFTLDPGEGARPWVTVTNFDFSAMTPAERASGVLTCSPGLHGVIGTMRVIVDPTLRDEVKTGTDPELFGSVEIVSALFRDEPPLDKGCWWGFNIRTIGDVSDIEQRMYLPDNPMRSMTPNPVDEIGRSLALNNSITDGCDTNETVKVPNPYRAHMPFLQTPTFASNIVGEVSFRARKYALYKGAQCAEVTLYGTRALNVDELQDRDWDILNVFIVSNTTYETYRFKTDSSAGYRAFRFAVTGVDGVVYPGPEPVCGVDPVRVLIDDVLVSEAVRARLAFRNVGAFRHDIDKTTYVPNVPSASEQPICGEGWGVQAEVYPAMLGEEIDTTTKPRVRLHYFKGLNPWGYSKWKAKATSAWLTAATDTNNFYRSSATDSPSAVIPMANSYENVQYMLEVVYAIVNSETGHRSLATNWLESVDWKVPSWYSPVDYNATLGAGQSDRFAAFSIIDSIAPGWAWINEINLFGSLNSRFQNSDRKKQFVEIAKPVEYDLNGWTLRMLSAQNMIIERPPVVTNDVALFGRDVSAQKSSPTAYNMSFIVVGNKDSQLSRATGEYDGAWSFATLDNKAFNNYTELGSYHPVAIQLIRPSGVIEHEIAILATNVYYQYGAATAGQYDSTNLVRIVKSGAANSTIFALPDDCVSTATSVGVFGSRGESADWWNNTMKLTPGRVNENQTIDPDHPTPGGEMIMVFASVDTSFGHIVQTVGVGTNTTEMQTVSLKRGSAAGLDIQYTVDPWYELGTVKETENGVARVPIITTNAVRRYTVNVAKGADRNVSVVASAAVDSRLRAYGLDERNRYTPAVLNWLERHRDAYGNDFYGWDAETGTIDDTIYLAKFVALSGAVTNDMTLTEMYWLDIDPTMGGMYFRAGMVRPPSQQVWVRPTYDPQHDPEAYTNLRVGVYMSISNDNGHAQERLGRSVWAPYVLRGLGKGETSWNYSPDVSSANSWTSVTFKVTGFLNNGLAREDDPTAWIPLRYFVFKETSFDVNFETTIDVDDPFSTRSPAYSQGWYRWVAEHGGVKPAVYLSWNLDARLQPITTEVLAPTNTIKYLTEP